MGKIVEKTVDLNANLLYLKHEIVADTSKTQAGIEFRNMAYGTITAVKFEARGYNAFGDEIQVDGKSTFDIVTQDLIISPKKYAKLDIVLPNNDIRKLDLKLKQVCYANGKIVDEQLENKVTYKIENLDGTGNLEELEAKRLLKKKTDEAVCFPKKIGQNWICICGYLNKNTDTICHQCGCRQIDIFEYCTEEKIQAQINEKKKKETEEQAKQEEERIRLEEEEKRQREEWERQETEQRIKKTRRNKIITGIVVGIVMCGVIGYLVNERVIIPKHKYNHAVSMMKNEKYQEAALEFSALGDYKDALKKTNEATYKNACQLLEAKLYDEAEKAFEGLGDYKDSADKIVEVENCKKQKKYDDAMALIGVQEGSQEEGQSGQPVEDAEDTAEETSQEPEKAADTGSSEDAATLDVSKSLTGTHDVEIKVKDYGTIDVQLDADTAPITVTNFIKLVQEDFYDGLTFHRIMDGFMIQGGDPLGNGTGGSDQTIKGEFKNNKVENNISHKRGVISMARSSDPDSASSQFFIVQTDSTFLDGDYAAFGEVTSGMDVVDAICKDAKPTDDNGTIPADQQPVIEYIKVLD